jgi:hypothetical protein
VNPAMTTSWRFEVLILSQLSVAAGDPVAHAKIYETKYLDGVSGFQAVMIGDTPYDPRPRPEQAQRRLEC